MATKQATRGQNQRVEPTRLPSENYFIVYDKTAWFISCLNLIKLVDHIICRMNCRTMLLCCVHGTVLCVCVITYILHAVKFSKNQISIVMSSIKYLVN